MRKYVEKLIIHYFWVYNHKDLCYHAAQFHNIVLNQAIGQLTLQTSHLS